MSKSTVTVILCNYNQAHWLPSSLEGIFSQTRPADEVLLLDDGSTDDSHAVFEHYASLNKNVRYLRNEVNRGLQYSIDRALQAATGDYVVWAASDDRLLPHFLERSMAMLERFPQAGLCFSELAIMKGKEERVERFAIDPNQGATFNLEQYPDYMAPETMRKHLRRRLIWMTSNSIVASRRAILEAGGFPPKLRWHSDYFTYTLIGYRYGVCRVPDMLCLMRANDDGYSASGANNPKLQRRVLSSFLDALSDPRYANMRWLFLENPVLFSPFGDFFLKVAMTTPRHWDFVQPYMRWMFEHRLGRPVEPRELWLKHLPRFLRANFAPRLLAG
ncbi:MAG TPA: glycosyltransferase family 2 protein [Azospirillum sp.]